jgi:hypothetical protein
MAFAEKRGKGEIDGGGLGHGYMGLESLCEYALPRRELDRSVCMSLCLLEFTRVLAVIK